MKYLSLAVAALLDAKSALKVSSETVAAAEQYVTINIQDPKGMNWDPEGDESFAEINIGADEEEEEDISL